MFYSNIGGYHVDELISFNLTNVDETNELEECDIKNPDTSVPFFELCIKCLKFAGLAMHLIFFVIVLAIIELHTSHMVYFVNLSIVGLMYIIYGLITFETEVICNLRSPFLCEFQGIFAHYCVYLSAFGVLSLAFYRLACVSMSSLNNFLSIPKLVLTLVLMWMIPFFIVLIPKYVLQVPINYSDAYLTCRMNFIDHLSYFFFFVSFSCIVPSLVIAVIYLVILFKIKKSKSRIRNAGCKIMTAMQLSGGSVAVEARRCSFIEINSSCTLAKAPEIRVDECPARAVECDSNAVNAAATTTCRLSIHIPQSSGQCPLSQAPSPQTQSTTTGSKSKLLSTNLTYLPSKNKSSTSAAELKLAFQFIILYLSFTIFAVANTIILFQVSAMDKYMSNHVLAFLRLLVWVYHFVNPSIYLGFHPVFIEKLKSRVLHKFFCTKKPKSSQVGRFDCNPNTSMTRNAVVPLYPKTDLSPKTSSRNPLRKNS